MTDQPADLMAALERSLKQPCGHSVSAISSTGEGTSHCGLCAEQAREIHDAAATGFDSGVHHERARIVAWLRGRYGVDWLGETIHVGDIAAGAITAGEHLQSEQSA